MVSAGHYLATAAGYRILEQGGNATDAGVAAVLVEVVYAGGGRPPAQTANLDCVLVLGVVDDDGSDAAKTGVLGQNNVDNYARGHSGVGGIATLFQDSISCRGGQVVTCRHHVGSPGYQRPIGVDSNRHFPPPVSHRHGQRVESSSAA